MDKLVKRVFAIDWLMIAALVPLLAAGLITMYSFSGENYFADRQMLWVVLSFAVFFIASFIDWRFLRRTSVVIVIYTSFIALLTGLLLFGSATKGAVSWINFGPVAFQPADFMKIVLIITLAKYFSRRHVQIAHYRHIILSGFYAFVPFLLILLQPDMGSAAMIIFIWLGMIVVSGVNMKHFLILVAFGIAGGLIAWLFVLAPYQKDRLITFVDPLRDIQGSGYNAFQSMVAVGSGELLGKNVGYGTQSRLEFLPEYETDFIFAAFAEEWGFVGATILFVLFGIVIWRTLAISTRGATNFEVLFGVGVASMFMAHIIINIGMNIGLLPVTGITLPFLSYGGSHLIAEFAALGMLNGMRRYASTVHKEDILREFVGPENFIS